MGIIVILTSGIWMDSREDGESFKTHRRFRGIEWKGGKIYDLQNVTFSILFKLYIVGLGLLIKKRYHMLG